MRFRFVVLAALVAPSLAPAQVVVSDERDVLAVVNRLFAAMRVADSAAARLAFASGARFALIDVRNSPPTLTYETPDRWLAGVANSAGRWDEQIYDTQVRIDGSMAQVWTPYTFYFDKKVRHCGVDAMELMKVGGTWQITQLSDTQRHENCRDPLGLGFAPPTTPRPPR